MTLDPQDVAEALALDIPADLDNAEPLALPDQRHAARALRRLAIMERQEQAWRDDAAAERAALDELVQPERDRIDLFLSDRLHGLQRARDWVLGGLDGWMRATNAADPKVVTVKVAAGEVRLRKQPAKIVIMSNEEAAVALPDTVAPVAVAAAKVKALVKPTGKAVALGELPHPVEIPEGYHAELAVDADGATVPGVMFLVADAPRFEWSANR